MTKAILVPFHMYTPFGKEFYNPLLNFFLANIGKYEKEYDHLYILDSNWNIDTLPTEQEYDIERPKVTVIKVDSSLRYYDAYKAVLPDIKETLILLMDNDMVVYKPHMITDAFAFLDEGYSVVSIYDTIGKTFPQMGGKSKVCPYWFCTRKELLMRYRDVDWSPDGMPEYETFGKLTEAMIQDHVYMYEWPEDKNSIYLDGRKDGEKSELTGTYHIRSGSVPAYLLATKKYGNMDTYVEYLQNQPSQEYHRQMAWYQYMGGDPTPILEDTKVSPDDWSNYMKKFIKYHGLQ